ncbi:hypothetical protein POM88_055106 [Heracleum sosnowskyi]|uniref:Uncharacterized protein n=1 Tax=Heracleum sosnowskyi TaxID=360622 RepID=A0AAD8GLH1_9APIA|nr:hypothetical protein POM88_055106 [Heracleum sosnowskyi]
MPEETELALRTRLDRPFHYDREGPYHITQYHHMKSRKIYTKLWRVEQEITEKLQKLKMECFGIGKKKAETQSGLSNSVYEDGKPLRLYYQAIEEKSNYFEIPESSEAFRKLWQEELEIIQKLHKLKLNRVKLDHKKKCFSTYTEAAYSRFNTRQKIEWKVKEIEGLKQSLYELYVSKRPRQRKESDISFLHEQVVKLHKGRQHGRNNLVKERQLLKKIDQAREEVEKISANSPSEPATRIYTWRGDILDTKEALTDYIKVTTRELKELRMKQVTYRAYDGRAELEKAVTEKEIRILERKLENVKQKKVQVSELQLKMKI